MTIAHVTQYQALFLDQPCIEFHKMSALNYASLLLDKDPVELPHDYLEVADLIQSDRPDLTGVSMATPDQVLVIDENNFVQDWISYTRAATVLTQDIWAQALSMGTPTQWAKLLALTQTLHLGEDKVITTYTITDRL